jgi:hypothetical protein
MDRPLPDRLLPDRPPTSPATSPSTSASAGLTRREGALALLALAAAPLSAGAAAATSANAANTANACTARSGPQRGVLVELYTSEGCSSCPPADAQLSRLATQPGRGGAQIVPLALHVPYWDGIGWKDPFAQPAFATRQRWLASANGQGTVYTPHYFVNGREALDWRSELAPALTQAATVAAPVSLVLSAQPESGLAWAVQAQATPQPGAGSGAGAAAAAAAADGTWQLLLALTESGLVSSIQAGENRGATLHHDHVVRQWLGPFALSAAGGSVTRELTPDSRWQRSRLGLAAFVQNARTGEVLQALALPLCGAA